MKYTPIKDYTFFSDNDHFVYKYEEDETMLHIYIKSKPHSCKCPKCSVESVTIHGTYERTIQDTPIHGKQTYLHTNIYKYKCLNSKCKQKVFVEKLPFAKATQTRTNTLNCLILGVAMFLSNEGASKVLSLLGVKISADAIQRLYDHIEFIDNPNVEAVGIDDVAIRKGHKYATAIYDLKDKHLIALLEGRDAETLKTWLKNHTKIHLVARDRASAYAAAINEILPECTQVADRFHLLQNLLEELKDIFYSKMPSKVLIQNEKILEEEPDKVLEDIKPNTTAIEKLNYDNSIPMDSEGKEVLYNRRRHADTKEVKEQREKKVKLIYDIKECWEKLDKKHLDEVVQRFKIGRETAKKYINMKEREINEIKYASKKQTKEMEDYINIIYKMLRDGVPGANIYFYILSKGYQGTVSNLCGYIYAIGKNNFANRSVFRQKDLKKKVYAKDVIIIKRQDILKYLLTVNPKTAKDKTIGKYIDLIKEKYPIAQTISEIFSSFHSIIMGDDPSKLDDFLNRYEESLIKKFCKSIKKDITPTKNAISFPVSSGFVEGNNNKFKLLKRIIYGKAKLVNLEKKCKLAFLFKKDDFSLAELL